MDPVVGLVITLFVVGLIGYQSFKSKKKTANPPTDSGDGEHHDDGVSVPRNHAKPKERNQER